MTGLRSFIVAGLLLTVFGSGRGHAETPPDPVRLVPAQADFIVQVPDARRLIERYTHSEIYQQLYTFEPVREFNDSTNMRRFRQLLAYFEKQLGTRWPEALDRLSGGGIVVAGKFGANQGPALLVVQGTDAALVKRIAQLGAEVLEQELARQESKEHIRRAKYRDLETIHIGKDFHAAVAGAAILLSNKEDVLHQSIDLHFGGATKSLAAATELQAARKLLPPQTLAWLWAKLDALHKSPPAKDLFKLPRNDVNLTILFGGLLDVIGRAPYVNAALVPTADGLSLSLRVPAGRDGMPEALGLHVPPAGRPASLPLLEPKSALFSTSYWFDLGKVWTERTKLFNDKQVKAFEEGEKRTGIIGTRAGELLTQLGPYQRVVVVNQPTAAYKKQPDQHVPAFALAVSLREPEKFEKAMNLALRGGALLISTQLKLKMIEEKIGAAQIVGYRFNEDEPLKGDDANVRFNFSPAFVRVGDQFVFASTIELARELVGQLQQEQRGPKTASLASATELQTLQATLAKVEKRLDTVIRQLAQTQDKEERSKQLTQAKRLDRRRVTLTKQAAELARQTKAQPVVSSAKERSQFYAEGLVDALRVNEDQLVAQTILNQALAPDAARKQVGVLIDMVRRLGVVQTETHYDDKNFRIDFRLIMSKK